MEPNKEQTWRKHGSQELGVVLYSFYIQLSPINFISSINLEVWQKSNFKPWLAWTRPYKSWVGSNGEKHGTQEPRLVLHSFHEQLVQINLVSSPNWKVWPKVKRSFPIGQTRPYKIQIWPKRGEKMLPVNLISNLNWGVWPKVKISAPDWFELGLIRVK